MLRLKKNWHNILFLNGVKEILPFHWFFFQLKSWEDEFGDMLHKEKGKSQARRSGIMALFIVAVFLICNIAECIWWLVHETAEVKKGYADDVFTCFTVFSQTFNSSINVIIYSIFGKVFRKKFLSIFCRISPDEENKSNFPTSAVNKPQILYNKKLSIVSKNN